MTTFAPHLDLCVTSEGIKFFYLIYDYLSNDPCNITCFSLNKETGETTGLTILPALDTKSKTILMNYTAVAVGSTIYMIGGDCPPNLCPDEVDDNIWHTHAEVRFFDTNQPEDGWREAAPMNVARVKPTAVVVDGIIYVFGGSGEPLDYGERFDPKTNLWRCFPAMGCRPSFACIQVPYVDSNGAKGLLVHSDHQNGDTLFAYTLGSEKWEVISDDFGKCHRPGAILDGIIYAVLEHEEQPLHGYHIMCKKWFPVELPELDFRPGTAWVFSSGSDKLCLVWRHLDFLGNFKDNRVECVELRLNKSCTYTEAAGITLTLTATKLSHTYFRQNLNFHRVSILPF